MKIHSYFYFVDNRSFPPYGRHAYNRLGKIRPVIDYVVSNVFEIYNPQRDISIDKVTILNKSHTLMKQYANKTVKRRFKIWMHGNPMVTMYTLEKEETNLRLVLDVMSKRD